MANDVAVKKDPVGNLMARLESGVQAALPSQCVKDAFLRAVQTSLRKTPRLMSCTPESLSSSIMDSAQFGLTIGLTGHLVPFGKECQLVIDYKGVLDMAYRHERVLAIDTDLVCENDQFEYERGADPKLKHTPDLRSRGKPYAVYAIAWLKDSDKPLIDVMSFDEIEAIRKSSKAGTSGPWKEYWGEMAKKTVIKRLCKKVPKSIELQSALHYEAQQDQRMHEVSARVVQDDDRRAGLAEKAVAASKAPKQVAQAAPSSGVTEKDAQVAYMALNRAYEVNPELVDEVLTGMGMPALPMTDISNGFSGDDAVNMVLAEEAYQARIGG